MVRVAPSNPRNRTWIKHNGSSGLFVAAKAEGGLFRSARPKRRLRDLL